MPINARCSESVEDALARLDRESKAKKLAQQQAVDLKQKLAEKPKENFLSDNALIESLRNEKSRKLYPERQGEPYKSGWFDVVFKGEGRENMDRLKCEMNVWKVVKKSMLSWLRFFTIVCGN